MKRFLPVFFLCFLFTANVRSQDIFKSENPDLKIQSGTKKTKGYFNITQASLLMGTIKRSSTSGTMPSELQITPSVTMTNGYMFNKHWAMGAGIGFEIFENNLFPVFADFRYTFSDKKITPFLALKSGYAFGNFRAKHHDKVFFNYPPHSATDADVRHYGGLLLNPELGISILLNENSNLLFTVAYRYQKTKTSVIEEMYNGDDYNKTQWDNKANLDRLSFGVAIMFK